MKRNAFFDKEALIRNLKIARINQYYKDFVKKSIQVAVMMDIMINVIIMFALLRIVQDTGRISWMLTLPVTLLLGFIVLFKFFIKSPEVKVLRSRKNIDAEIISAIRFLVLDLKANAPIFDALRNMVKNFDEIGNYLREIIIKVELGSSMEDVLNETVELVPSENFRVLLWQIINHLQTGSDISSTLAVIVDEIVEKQKIEFKKYGKKLNVLSLFYMIIAIILPTIGFTLISAGLLFIGIPFSYGIVALFWIIFTLLQVVFLAMSSGNRPVVEQ